MKRKEDTEDTVQETFVKIYLNAKKFKKEKTGDSFKNWAYKILINCAISRYGKLKKNAGIQPAGHKRFGRKNI